MNNQTISNDAPAPRDRENKMKLVRAAAANLRDTITYAARKAFNIADE